MWAKGPVQSLLNLRREVDDETREAERHVEWEETVAKYRMDDTSPTIRPSY
jgi:hypothetical protein